MKVIEQHRRHTWSFLTKLAFLALLGNTILYLLDYLATVIFVGSPVIALLELAGVTLIVVCLFFTRARWIPALGALASLVTAWIMLSHSTDHLIHPTNVPHFSLLVIGFACSAIAVVAGLWATIQRYWSTERRTPRVTLAGLIGLVAGITIGMILLAQVVASNPLPVGATTVNGEPTVYMDSTSFLENVVLVPKGSRLMLVDAGQFLHELSNGTWQNGRPHPATEPGAPIVNHLQVNSESVEIGPFTTAGIYHIYCTIHKDMQLTIVVQ